MEKPLEEIMQELHQAVHDGKTVCLSHHVADKSVLGKVTAADLAAIRSFADSRRESETQARAHPNAKLFHQLNGHLQMSGQALEEMTCGLRLTYDLLRPERLGEIKEQAEELLKYVAEYEQLLTKSNPTFI